MILNSLYLLVSITGLWAGPFMCRRRSLALANREGVPATQSAWLGMAILSIGTIHLRSSALPILAEKLGGA